MKTNGNDKALESYKIFPFIAWTLIIGFALFVYSMIMELKASTERLSARTELLEQHVRTAPGSIVDFEQAPAQ